jgi:type IV pilus assembly protein PilN
MTTRLNLLPWREMRRQEQDRQLLVFAGMFWSLMGLIVLYGYLHVSTLTDNQIKRNEYLQQEIARLDKEIKEIADLKKSREALIARMNVIYQLQADRIQVVHLFDELARRLPEGVYLTSFKHGGTSISLRGVAQSNARVSAFMRNLAGSDWFAEPELEVINVRSQGNDRVSDFALKVKHVAKKKTTDDASRASSGTAAETGT